MDGSMNKVMTGLLFNITGALTQFELLEKAALESSIRIQQTMAKTALTMGAGGGAAGQMTAQQAMAQTILKEGEARKAAIVAEGEAKISAIQAKEALTRQGIAQKEAQTMLAITREQVAQQQLMYMRARQTAFESQPTGMLGLIGRHATWMAAGFAVFGTLSLLKDGLVDVETGMKGLQTVLPELAHDQEAYNEASREAIDIMQKYGSSLDDTMTSARSFGRMYKEIDTVMGLVNNATLLNVIDQVKLEDAVKGNEVALSTYGEALKSTNEVLAFSGKLMDSITILSHNTLATGTDLVNILQQTSSAAKQAGTDLDQLMGTGAAAIRATGLQGQGGNIGRALRTVFTQLSAPSEAVEKEINDIGVSLRNLDTGELRSAYDIILDLSLATSDAKLSQEELNEALLKASSGKFQYNKLSALVGQFDDIVKNTAMSISSQGKTLEMAGQQLDTISRKAGMLKATLTDMFSGAGDSGLREEIKGLLDGVNQFIMGLNNLDIHTVNTGVQLLKLMATWKAMAAVYNFILPLTASVTLMADGLTFAQARQIVATNGATAALTMERTALIATAAATEGAAVATKGFTLALIKNPLGLVITGLTAIAGTLLYKYIDKMGEAEMATTKLSQAQQDEYTNAQQTANQMNTTIDYLTSLKEKHVELTTAINSGKLSTAELTEANKNLAAVDESVMILTDSKTRELIKANGVTEQEIQLVINSAVKSKEAAISKMEDQKKLTDESIKQTEKRIKLWGQENNLMMAMSGKAPVAKSSFLNNTAVKDKGGGFLGIMDAENAALEAQRQKANDTALAIMAARGEIEKLKHSSGPESSPGGTPSSTATDKVKTYSEAWQDYIDTLESGLPAVNDVLADHNNALDILGTKESIWQSTTDGIIPSLEQQQEEYANLSQTIMEYQASQEDLHATADQYRAQMASILTLIAQEDSKLAAGTITKKQHRESVQLLQNEYDKLDKSVDSMGSQWMKDQYAIIQTQQEYDNLDDSIAKLKFDELKQKFDNNLISAEQYRVGIEGLEREFTSLGSAMANTLQQAEFNTILSGWNTAIDEALDKAQKKFDKAMDNIDNDIEDAKQGLEDFKDAVSGIFDDVDTDNSANFSEGILQKISEYLPAMLNAPADTFGAIENALYPVSENLSGTLANIGTTMSGIVNGVYKATDNELEVSKETFLSDLEENINGLNDASNQINVALNDVESWKNSEIRRIDSEIETIKNKLESDVKFITGLFDELDAAEAKHERDTAKNNFTNSLNAAMGIATTPGITPSTSDLATLAAGLPGQLDLSNLGNLSAEQFANTIKQGLTTLGNAKITAEGYIQDLANSTQSQIDAIDAELKALDEETKADTRADAEEEHNRKIKELQEQLAYEQVRTGQEHVENIKDINAQIEEENRSWAETQEDYAREDKRSALEEKKTTLQKNTELMNQALSDFVTYINSEIQTRKTATEDFKTQLTEKANADTAELEVERTNVEERGKLLTTMLTGMRQYVTDEIAEWQRLADERTDILESEVNEFIQSQNSLKESMTDLWNDKKTGIVAITKNGVLATLAMMAAMSDGFKTQGMAMVQGLIDGITDKDLANTLTTELQNILSAVGGTTTAASTTKVPWEQVFTNADGNAFKSGFLASSNGDGTANVYRADGSLFGVYNISDASRANSSDTTASKQAAAHAKAEAARAKIRAISKWYGDNNKNNLLDIDEDPNNAGQASTLAQAQSWFNANIKGKNKAGESYFQNILDAREEYTKAGEGALFTKPAMTMIAEAGESEFAMPLSKLQPMMNEAVLASLTQTTKVVPDLTRISSLMKQIDTLQAQISIAVNNNFDKAADRIIAAIENKMNLKIDNLVNVEHYEPQDNTDIEVFSREIMRQVGQR